MPTLRLIHWKESETAEYVDQLTRAGYQIAYDEKFLPGLMKRWRESPPDIFLIDLSRLPSHGKEIAVALRQSPATRHIPLVFCGGNPEKVDALRSLLPDASYCEFPGLLAALKRALAHPPKNPVRPTAMMDRYKSRTVAQKLGIKEGASVALVNPPRNSDRIIGPLPGSVILSESEDGDPAAMVHLIFVHRPDQLLSKLSQLRHLARTSKFWVVWRKGGKAAAGDVTEKLVREHALDLGLVDYKICAVDEIWTAMLFSLKG